MAAACVIMAPLCSAQQWPDRPVRILVPFPPGGGTDIQARLLSTAFQKSMGQNFIIDNRTGAGGIIAAQLAVDSPPDGNTILFTSGSISVAVTLYAKRMKFDVQKDLAPISWISYKDVARAAATAVAEPAARNRIVELGGPQALSAREVVRMFGAAGAGEITTESVPEAALAAQLSAATDPLEKTFAGLMLQCVGGDAIDPAVSSRLFPFRMTSVRDFIAAQLARV